MGSKLFHLKYLAIILMGIVVLLLVAFDALSATKVMALINQ